MNQIEKDPRQNQAPCITEEILNKFKDVPFHDLLGIQILETETDRAKVLIDFKQELAGGINAFHGGVVSSLIDLTGGLAAWCGHHSMQGHNDVLNMKRSTLMLSIQYLSNVNCEPIIAEGVVTKRTKELIFSNIEVRSQPNGKLIATGSMVYRISE